MNRRKSLGVGSVSLILIFCVLCLTIFTLLTLSSARSEMALTEKLAYSVENYYSADTRAQLVLYRLEQLISEDTRPEEIDGLEISYEENNGETTVNFLSPIDEQRSIAVEIQFAGGSAEVLRWQETENALWSPDDHLPVMQ